MSNTGTCGFCSANVALIGGNLASHSGSDFKACRGSHMKPNVNDVTAIMSIIDEYNENKRLEAMEAELRLPRV